MNIVEARSVFAMPRTAVTIRRVIGTLVSFDCMDLDFPSV